MPQWIKSYPSQKANTQAITAVAKVTPPSKSTSKPLPASIEDGKNPEQCLERCKSDGEKAPERPGRVGFPFLEGKAKLMMIPTDTPCRAPQTWESELPDFDWTASPGAEEWQSGETADGCAVYSVVTGVTVEFQKWDW